MLEEGARVTVWDTHEACPGYIEVDDRRTTNENLLRKWSNGLRTEPNRMEKVLT